MENWTEKTYKQTQININIEVVLSGAQMHDVFVSSERSSRFWCATSACFLSLLEIISMLYYASLFFNAELFPSPTKTQWNYFHEWGLLLCMQGTAIKQTISWLHWRGGSPTWPSYWLTDCLHCNLASLSTNLLLLVWSWMLKIVEFFF